MRRRTHSGSARTWGRGCLRTEKEDVEIDASVPSTACCAHRAEHAGGHALRAGAVRRGSAAALLRSAAGCKALLCRVGVSLTGVGGDVLGNQVGHGILWVGGKHNDRFISSTMQPH